MQNCKRKQYSRLKKYLSKNSPARRDLLAYLVGREMGKKPSLETNIETDINKDLCVLRALKTCNRKKEQSVKVEELLQKHGSIRKLAEKSGMNRKHVAKLCQERSNVKKSSDLSKRKRKKNEVLSFANQEHVSTSMPSVKMVFTSHCG